MSGSFWQTKAVSFCCLCCVQDRWWKLLNFNKKLLKISYSPKQRGAKDHMFNCKHCHQHGIHILFSRILRNLCPNSQSPKSQQNVSQLARRNLQTYRLWSTNKTTARRISGRGCISCIIIKIYIYTWQPLGPLGPSNILPFQANKVILHL